MRLPLDKTTPSIGIILPDTPGWRNGIRATLRSLWGQPCKSSSLFPGILSPSSQGIFVNPKQIAAERAVSYVQSGMTLGLGTGSTAAYAIHALGQRFQKEDLELRCVATSHASEELGLTYGLRFVDHAEVRRFDITIDGADEVDPDLRLIKGGGGALVREKIVAAATDTEIIIVDSSKVKPALGVHPLPVAIFPFAWQWTQARIEETFSVAAPLRLLSSGQPFLSDDGLSLLDIAFGAPLTSPDTLESALKTIVGVAEVGLFIGHCQRLIIGFADGHIEEKAAPARKG